MPEPEFETVDGVDPLLAFAQEPGTASQPPERVDAVVDAAEPSRLASHVDELEQSIAATKRDVESMRSDLATLVRAVDDLKKRTRRPSQVAAVPAATRTPSYLGSVVIGVLLGIAAGVAVWYSRMM